MEAVQSWIAASEKNVMQLGKQTGPIPMEGLLFWWDGQSVTIEARTVVLVTSRSTGTYNRKIVGQ